jgi:hypothetical protein
MSMSSEELAAVAERFRIALDLHATGEAMMRHRIRRLNPGMADEVVEARVAAWLRKRLDVEHGDAAGRAGNWPRRVLG